jgi:hypothetical protein
MKKSMFILFAMWMLVSNQAWSGAICVVALWKGSVIDHVFLTGEKHPHELQAEAEDTLAKRGYDNYDRGLDIRHARGQSYLKHGYAVIIESKYIPPYRKVQKERRSIGCGFSAKSWDDALWDAIHDLQAHDWSWVPDRDEYTVLKKVKY